MRCSAIVLSLSAVVTFAATSDAQRRDRGEDLRPEHRPPRGMCRLWIPGIAPGLQPKPTDCASAERAAGEKGRVIYGEGVALPPLNDPVPWCYGADGRRVDCSIQDRPGGRLEDVAEGRLDRGVWDRSNYPRRLPEMANAVLYQRGERPQQVRRWLGDRYLIVRFTDADNNGTPERVVWRNRREEVLQVWTDRNRDGRADRVEFWENGRRVRTVE